MRGAELLHPQPCSPAAQEVLAGDAVMLTLKCHWEEKEAWKKGRLKGKHWRERDKLLLTGPPSRPPWGWVSSTPFG